MIICDKELCTGCGLCSSTCPVHCITMEEDKYVFLYPVINPDKCINCGKCKKRCPVITDIESCYPLKSFAAWSLDLEDRETSSSGGVASVLANQFIASGGVVYGCAYKDGEVKHIRVANVNDLHLLKGSKYTQSKITGIIPQICSDIRKGNKVLFLGTPCQVATIQQIAPNEKIFNNLLVLVDVVCHGVPSQRMLKEHLLSVVGRNEIVTDLRFRIGNEKLVYAKTERGKEYRGMIPKDAYILGFEYALFLRPSCYKCKFAQPQRCGDITLGDYWGLGETFYSKEKVSLLMVNSDKGLEFFNECKSNLFLDERKIEEGIKGNNALCTPAKKHPQYNIFHFLYPLSGYKSAVNMALLLQRLKIFLSRVYLAVSHT